MAIKVGLFVAGIALSVAAACWLLDMPNHRLQADIARQEAVATCIKHGGRFVVFGVPGVEQKPWEASNWVTCNRDGVVEVFRRNE